MNLVLILLTEKYTILETELGKILIVDDDEDVLLAARLLLKKHAQKIVIENDPRQIPYLLNHENFDVILLDMNFSKDITSGKEGFDLLDKILTIDPKAVVILITAFGDVEMAVRALKQGATDFILKPWQNEKLIATLSAAAKLRQSYQEVDTLKKTNTQLAKGLNEPYKEILGESQAIKNVFNIIDKVAGTDANVLILGENGTGKELVARAIHEKSLRRDNVYIGVDMGAVTETLFESELFGHKKGAFTDAREDRIGRFELANKGTLFLDEIGNLSPALQSKLLTALQNRTVTRIGANNPIKVDIRLICATNMPLYDMVKENKFRQDLLYRINTVEVHLPPLRERLEDIPILTSHFIEMYCKKYRKPLKQIPSATVKKLQQYGWPGNVRELQHAIERAIIMSDGNQLQPDDFFFLQGQINSAQPKADSLNLDEIERDMIQKAISKHNGNIAKAAKELGLARATLYRRLEKHGL
jgi:two-component system response regulator HydG